VDVSPGVNAARVFRLLRRHVVGSAHDLTGLRQVAQAGRPASKPEVRHACPSLAIDKDVGRLQVTVDNALFRSDRHPLTYVLHPPYHLLLAERTTVGANQVIKVGPVHPFHDEYWVALRQDIEVVYRDDVRRLDLCQQLRLAEEPFRWG